MSILSDILGSTAGSTVAALTPAATVDIDLTSDDFFTLTPDQNTTFTVSNVPASPDVGKFNLTLTGFTTSSVTYDIGGAVYDSKSKLVSAQNTEPYGLAFKPDGTKMYMLGQGGNTVYQYTLSTPWDVSTATYDTISKSVAAQDTQTFSVSFKPDGLKMYTNGTTNGRVYQYTLSTAWDVSTATYDSVFKSVSAQDTQMYDAVFKPDGTKMYTIGWNNKRVYQYTLSTAWDLSTATYDSISFLVSGQDTSPNSIAFNSDGTEMYMLGQSGNSVYQYTLSTPWVVSSATYDSISFSVVSQGTSGWTLVLSADGLKMYYASNTNDTVFQYSIGANIPATTTYPASFKFPTGTAPDAPLGEEIDILEFQTTDGGTTWYGTQLGNNFL
jgi:sugar lactone lactonase YvrE